MTLLARLRRWLAGPARARRLHHLRRQRFARDLPGMLAQADAVRAQLCDEIAAGRVTYEVSWLNERERCTAWVDAVELQPMAQQPVPVGWFHQLSEGS